MESPRKIQIAISGGGLAGSAIARALFQQPHLEVHIYESAPKFSERSQAIGMAINDQRVLARLIPDAEEMFSRAGAVSMNSTRIMIVSRMIHRAALLRELLSPIPDAHKHANKKLILIEEQPQGLLLKFEDELTVNADALIGADGIFGFVRAYVLGADHAAVKPVAAGWAGAMNMVPFDKAEDKLGAEVFKENRQYGWVGENGIFIHDSVMNGKMVQCIGTSVHPNPDNERRIPVNREYMERTFSKFLDGPVAKGVIDLLLDQDDPVVYAQFEHTNAPTCINGRVCIAGDAAHAMTPWQGSGAATALEDAAVLGALFEQIDSQEQVERVLKTYDAVCRPRSQRIVESSRQTGRILSGLAEGVGLDPVKMHAALKDRWTFIHDFDLDGYIKNAQMMLKAQA